MKRDILYQKLHISDEIPPFIEENIEHTLANLNKTTLKKGKTIRFLLVAVCILGLGTLGGVFAKDKVTSLLTEYLNPQAESYDLIKTDLLPTTDTPSPTAKDENKPINNVASATSNGVTVRFTDMAYDGKSIIAGAEIELSDDLVSDNKIQDIYMLSSIYYTDLYDKKSALPQIITDAEAQYEKGEISGEALDDIYNEYANNYSSGEESAKAGPHLMSGSALGAKFTQIGTHTFKGYLTYAIDSTGEPSDNTLTFLSRHIDINYVDKSITLDGDWRIDTGYSEKDIYVEGTVYDVTPKTVSMDRHTFTVSELFASPINTLITIEGRFDDEQYLSNDLSANWLQFFITDNDNQCLNNQVIVASNDINSMDFHRVIRLNNLTDISELKVIPYMDNVTAEKLYRMPYTQLPGTLEVQDMTVEIYDFEKTESIIRFYYKTDGLIPEKDRINIRLCNEQGETFVPDINSVDYETGIGYVECSNLNSYNSYDLSETTHIVIPHRDYALLEAYQFHVTLK